MNNEHLNRRGGITSLNPQQPINSSFITQRQNNWFNSLGTQRHLNVASDRRPGFSQDAPIRLVQVLKDELQDHGSLGTKTTKEINKLADNILMKKFSMKVPNTQDVQWLNARAVTVAYLKRVRPNITQAEISAYLLTHRPLNRDQDTAIKRTSLFEILHDNKMEALQKQEALDLFMKENKAMSEDQKQTIQNLRYSIYNDSYKLDDIITNEFLNHESARILVTRVYLKSDFRNTEAARVDATARFRQLRLYGRSHPLKGFLITQYNKGIESYSRLVAEGYRDYMEELRELMQKEEGRVYVPSAEGEEQKEGDEVTALPVASPAVTRSRGRDRRASAF